MNADRETTFRTLQREVNENLALIDVTSQEMSNRGHNCWIWDATQLPTNSHYFPVYCALLETLEKAGNIHPDRDILVETTTGSAGASFAFVARRLGYEAIVIIPEDMPTPRKQVVEEQLPETPNSQILYSPPGQYVKGLVGTLRRFLVKHRGGIGDKAIFAVDHSRRPESCLALGAAVTNVLSELPPGVTIDRAVVALGNGTSATGMKLALSAHNPNATLIGMEPLEAPNFFIKKYGAERFVQTYGVAPRFHQHLLIGTGGWGVEFPLLKTDDIDEIRLVGPSSWQTQKSRLTDKGFLVGNSSAACYAVIQQQSMLEDDKQLDFFSIFYDSSDRY